MERSTHSFRSRHSFTQDGNLPEGVPIPLDLRTKSRSPIQRNSRSMSLSEVDGFVIFLTSTFPEQSYLVVVCRRKFQIYGPSLVDQSQDTRSTGGRPVPELILIFLTSSLVAVTRQVSTSVITGYPVFWFLQVMRSCSESPHPINTLPVQSLKPQILLNQFNKSQLPQFLPLIFFVRYLWWFFLLFHPTGTRIRIVYTVRDTVLKIPVMEKVGMLLGQFLHDYKQG